MIIVELLLQKYTLVTGLGSAGKVTACCIILLYSSVHLYGSWTTYTFFTTI